MFQGMRPYPMKMDNERKGVCNKSGQTIESKASIQAAINKAKRRTVRRSYTQMQTRRGPCTAHVTSEIHGMEGSWRASGSNRLTNTTQSGQRNPWNTAKAATNTLSRTQPITRGARSTSTYYSAKTPLAGVRDVRQSACTHRRRHRRRVCQGRRVQS